MLKEFDIQNGGVSNLNKYTIEDYAPKELIDESLKDVKKEKKKINLLTEKEQ